MDQIKDILEGSKTCTNFNGTCINFNGTWGEFFSCKRGVRQGDPLSLFLFELVADVLNIILFKAQQKGHI